MWWLTPSILALVWDRQKDCSELETSFGCTVNHWVTRATCRVWETNSTSVRRNSQDIWVTGCCGILSLSFGYLSVWHPVIGSGMVKWRNIEHQCTHVDLSGSRIVQNTITTMKNSNQSKTNKPVLQQGSLFANPGMHSTSQGTCRNCMLHFQYQFPGKLIRVDKGVS